MASRDETIQRMALDTAVTRLLSSSFFEGKGKNINKIQLIIIKNTLIQMEMAIFLHFNFDRGHELQLY